MDFFFVDWIRNVISMLEVLGFEELKFMDMKVMGCEICIVDGVYINDLDYIGLLELYVWI